MKKLKILLLGIVLLGTASCTTYVKEDKKNVVYEKTGQTITANILCKPEEKDLLELYEKHNKSLKVKLEDLPKCENFHLNSVKYSSLWESIFVKPLAWIIIKLGVLVKNYGLAVILVTLLIRLIMVPITKKSTMQQQNIKKAQPELARIERKYANKQDTDSMMAKSQEMMMVYKKYNINPISGCLLAFIQLPLFFAFLEAINRVPAIFEGTFLPFINNIKFELPLGMTPLVGITKGYYIYIVLIALIILTTYFSFKLTQDASANNEQMGQMKFMTNFMLIMISIASLSLPTAIALYWIVNSAFGIIQTWIIKKVSERRK